MEPASAGDRGGGVCSEASRATARTPGGTFEKRFPGDAPRHSRDARRVFGILAQCGDYHGNQRRPQYRPAVEWLATSADAMVAEHAQWALKQLVD